MKRLFSFAFFLDWIPSPLLSFPLPNPSPILSTSSIGVTTVKQLHWHFLIENGMPCTSILKQSTVVWSGESTTTSVLCASGKCRGSDEWWYMRDAWCVMRGWNSFLPCFYWVLWRVRGLIVHAWSWTYLLVLSVEINRRKHICYFSSFESFETQGKVKQREQRNWTAVLTRWSINLESPDQIDKIILLYTIWEPIKNMKLSRSAFPL
jgi:hypothetical protein